MALIFFKKLSKIARIFLVAIGFQLAAYGQIKPETQVDLSPVELVTDSIELSQNIPSSAVNTPTSTIPSAPNIGTSRPSFTDAVTTVPQGSLNVESGATYTDNRGGSYSWTTPETLLRLGITANTEFRYTVPNYTYIGNNHPGSITNNWGDSSVGLSHHLVAPGKIDVALIPILNIPTGANNASSNSVDPQFRFVAGKNWTPKWLMSSMMDIRWNTGRNAAAEVVMTPTFINYYGFTPKLIGFLEYASLIPSTGKTSQFVQTGVEYLVTPRQQLDARIAVGLNKTSPNILVGFGYSFRVDGLFGASRAFSSFKK